MTEPIAPREMGARDEDLVEDLVALARRGNHDALGLLLGRYQGRAYAAACRILGDPEDARDACQEGLIRAFRGLSGYDPRRPFVAWLLGIVVHQAIDLQRRRRRELDLARNLPPPDFATVEVSDLRLSLAQVLDRLTPRERTALVLRDLEELPVDQVARAMGCARVTVRVLLHRARARVRAILEEEP